MNFLQLADEVLVRLGAASDDALLSLAARKAFINTAIRRIEADLDNPDWLHTRTTFLTAAGSGTYSVPSDWARSISLRVTTATGHLRYVSAQSLDEDYPGSGTPVAWREEGTSLYLRPVPSAAVTVEHRYIRQEPTLVGDSDVPVLPARFHDAAVEFACTLGARRLGQYDRAKEHEGAYAGWVKTMADEQGRVARPVRASRLPRPMPVAK